MHIFILLLLSNLVQASPYTDELVRSLSKCYPAKDLHQHVVEENEMRAKLQRPDFRLRLTSGYSNNEISSANPERFQMGANIRWDDIFDQQRRTDYQASMGELKKHESKLLLENFWRLKIADYYFWKWGLASQAQAKSFLKYTQKKLEAGQDSFQSLATSKIYSDLIELNRLSSEFLGRLAALDLDFSHCSGLKNRSNALDFDLEEVKYLSGKKSNRLLYQTDACTQQKKIKSISLEREAGLWGVSLSTSLNRNRQLSGGNNQFNDIRAGVEVTIPITGAKAHAVTVDSCDYEARLMEDQDYSERSFAQSLYPVLNTLQKQFQQLKQKADLLEGNLNGPQTQEVVQLGLNFFQLHQSLSSGEAKMNARLLPSRIVEYEF